MSNCHCARLHKRSAAIQDHAPAPTPYTPDLLA